MLQVNLSEANGNLYELINLLSSGQQDKIVLKDNDKAVAELVIPEQKTPRKSMFGAMKGKYYFAPDFDEWFDAMDAEIAEMFSDDPNCDF